MSCIKPLRLSRLDRTHPIHLAGIAGSAMNGLATVLHDLGFQVVGTDPRAEMVRERLGGDAITVFREQDGSRIPENAALVVASAALRADHPEIVRAQNLGIPIASYAECVGALMAERRGVAVAGTHGKTTVTSMIVSVLRKTGANPGFVIGGFIPALGSGAAAGDGDLFVAEACEYNRSFLHLHPEVAVITGIEADHLDIYGTLDNIKAAFAEFAANLPEGRGMLIHSAACANTPSVIENLNVEKISFGVEMEADIVATDFAPTADGVSFTLVVDGEPLGPARLAVPGRYNVANALAAVGVTRALGIDPMTAISALADFRGAGRRFELRGEVNGITLIDDYAHHPTALRLLLRAARERYPGRRIVLAFQPHQYSRTLQLLDDFGASVAEADRVFVPNIYFARDMAADVQRFDPAVLEAKMGQSGTPVTYLGSLEKLIDALGETLRPEDVLITAGAGDIDKVIDPLLAALGVDRTVLE